MAPRSLLSVASLLVAVLGVAHAHEWSLGRCPRVSSVDNLSVDKFLGVWYVIEQFDTRSRCLLLNYTRVSETQLRVTKLRQFHMLDRVGIDHTNSYTGSLDMPHEHDLARLRVKWPLNLAGKGDYVIFDTDYTTYAGIYECQGITSLMHRRSAAILSRTPTLAQEYVSRIKRLLTSYGVPINEFDKIKHEGCRTRADADINVHVDSDTFRHMIEGTRAGIEGAATTLANGFRELATTVSQAGQDTLSTIQSTAQTAFSDPDPQVEVIEESDLTILTPVAENVDTGLQAETGDTFNIGVERDGEAFDEAIEKADEAIKDVNDFTKEKVEVTNQGSNVNNYPRGIAATILGRRNNVPGSSRSSSVPETTRQSTASVTTVQATTTPLVTVTNAVKTTTTNVVEHDNANNIDENMNSIFENIKNFDENDNGIFEEDTNKAEERNKKNHEDNYYRVVNAEDVIPVDDIVRTVVSIDKKKK